MKLRQKNSKVLAAVLKTLTVHALSFSLLYSPTVAAQNALLDGAGAILNGIQGFGQQMQQQRQQQLAQAQMQSQMQALQPQPVPSQYFPRCAVSKAVTDFPEGACDNPPAPGDQAGVGQLQSFKALSVSYESFFENLLAENQNSGAPQGPQCLKEEAARAEAQIQDKINALQALIGKVNKEIQAFDQANRKIKEQMEDVRSELYGSPADQEDRNKTLLTQFSGTCQTYFAGNNAQIRTRGFSALRDEMDTVNADAGRFKNNSKGYEAELKAMVGGIEKEVKRGGLSVLIASDDVRAAMRESGSTTEFGSLTNVVNAKARNLQRNLEVLQKDLSDVGFEVGLSDFDGDFQEKFKNFSEGSLDYFKKEAVSNCVSGADRTLGTGLTTDQILNGLRHRNFGSGGGPTQTLNNYKAALSEILNSDAFIQDKMNSIAALDRQYGVGNIFIQTKRAGQTDYPTPYGLYQAQIEYCEAQVTQNDTFSTDPSKRSQLNGSYADRIQRAEKALKKALLIEKEFVSELSNAIINRVKNCEGIEYKADSCIMGSSGNSSAIATGNPNFCIAHATTCSNQIQSCFQEADTIVKKKQQQMATLGAQHNAQVSGLVARQEFFLNQIKAQVVADAEFIKRTFPGVAYEFPNDLFVELPEEVMSPKFGVALRGGDSNNSLVKDLPLKMEGLVNILKQQKQKANGFWKDYIAKQTQGMKSDAKKWSQLKEQCNAAIAGYNEAVNMANQAEAEGLGKTAGFCQKFDALASNPMAGCGDADQLFEDSMNISAGLQAANITRQAALEYKQFCNQANNEREAEDQERSSEEDEFLALNDACNDNPEGTDFEDLLAEDVMAQLPSDFRSERELIQKFLNNELEEGVSLPRSLRSTPYYTNVLRPAQRALTGAYSRPSFPEPREGEDNATVEDFEKLFDFTKADYEERYSQENWDKMGFCARHRVHQLFEAAADNNTKNGATFIDEARSEASSLVISGSAPSNAARAIASINTNVTTSDSGRIGERMRGAPCMAQQGYNGAQGFNLNSFDASILGPDASGVLNSITGGR